MDNKPKVYELTITPSYVPNWGLKEAVRELLQNALDHDSVLDTATRTGDGVYGFKILSTGVTLPVSSLLLGSTNKNSDNSKLGQFGEGYKLALLVLCRLGYKVTVLNGMHKWMPTIQHSSVYGTEVLTITTEMCDYLSEEGIQFIIDGLSAGDMDTIKSSCLQLQPKKPDHEVLHTQYGDILLKEAGKLYCGGLFVCDTELKFGYNMNVGRIPLDRDRSTVNEWDLLWATSEMWADTNDYKRVANLLNNGVRDVKHLVYRTNDHIADACNTLFVKHHSDSVPVSSQSEIRDYAAQGITNTVVVNPTFAEVLKAAPEYKEPEESKLLPPVTLMHNWLTKHKLNLTAPAISEFNKLLDMAVNWEA